jgi:hypothetical protein
LKRGKVAAPRLADLEGHLLDKAGSSTPSAASSSEPSKDSGTVEFSWINLGAPYSVVDTIWLHEGFHCRFGCVAGINVLVI